VAEGKGKVAATLNKLRFDLFFFTGSTQKGKLVAAQAAPNLVPCVLELGGKSPVVVDEDADITWAAKKVLCGTLTNHGQVCIAPDYMLIHESRLEQFMDEFKKYFKHAFNNNENNESGKIVNSFHHRRLCSMLEDHGGEVLMGNPNAHKDHKLELTVIKNPKRGSKALTEEIFGPILPVLTYKHFDEVISYITTEQEKPLALYFFGTRNGPNQQRIINETSSGAVATNEVIMQVASAFLPFGGVGHSGYGRYHSKAGFETMSNMKSCLVKPVADFRPFNGAMPPHTAKQREDLRKMFAKPAPTQALVGKALLAFVLVITLITLAIVCRK